MNPTSNLNPSALDQDELKTMVGQAALKFVVKGALVGVGTGSTVNKFIDALASIKNEITGVVSSSQASTDRLLALGFRVFDANEVEDIPVYIDGADELDTKGYMIKGGGGALTREKIIAAQARKFVCIVDESKFVQQLGQFPLPLEVIPMASKRIIREFLKIGGQANLRQKDGKPFVTDNGHNIVDVSGLKIRNPRSFETQVSQWPGVLTVGVFAFEKANVGLISSSSGIKELKF